MGDEDEVKVILQKHGANQHSGVDNINSTSDQGGTNADYLVARLRRDRPDIAERVEAGELSANAGAIEITRGRPESLPPGTASSS